MPKKNTVGGRATVTTTSLGVLRTQKGSTLYRGAVKKTGVTDDQGVAGKQHEPTVPYIECTITEKAGVDVEAIDAIDDEDISFETDAGSHFILKEAWNTGESTLVAGEIKTKFEGVRCLKVSA